MFSYPNMMWAVDNSQWVFIKMVCKFTDTQVYEMKYFQKYIST